MNGNFMQILNFKDLFLANFAENGNSRNIGFWPYVLATEKPSENVAGCFLLRDLGALTRTLADNRSGH